MSVLTSAARMWLTRSLQPFQFSSAHNTHLEFQNEQTLGLYVHIPFCRTLCEFCPYCKTVYNKQLAEQYLAALLQEIDLVGGMAGGKKIQVSSLYFGGGSPALLAEGIHTIISRLQQYFVITQGIGLELHPQDVTEETLTILKQAGVTKISIGVQSFQLEYLKLLGRKPLDFERMARALAQVPFETVSVDLIFALPGQNIRLLQADLEMAFGLGANHVAVYPFIDFTFTGRHFKKMQEREKKHLLYQLLEYCETQGYVRDSIWTFSKGGTSGYSSMTRDLFLGFGCSATSLLRNTFTINTFDVAEYINRIEQRALPTALALRFTPRQRMVYYLFWTAYTMRVKASSFHTFFGASLERCYGLELFLAKLFGLVRQEQGGYTLTSRGSYYFHYFEHFYTLSYIDQMWHLLRNKAFPEQLVIR